MAAMPPDQSLFAVEAPTADFAVSAGFDSDLSPDAAEDSELDADGAAEESEDDSEEPPFAVLVPEELSALRLA
jgi:hypothetical protein